VTAACFVILRTGQIECLFRVIGNVVLSRLLGVILAALAVQYVIDGVRAVWVG
jgi:multiple antibiotic resistance protein